MGGIRDGGIAGVVVALTVELGLDQINLDIAHGEGVFCALGVGEVSQRCAHNGDGYKSDTQEDCGKFLFHVRFAPLCSDIFSAPLRKGKRIETAFKKAAFPKSNYDCAAKAVQAAAASAKPSA